MEWGLSAAQKEEKVEPWGSFEKKKRKLKKEKKHDGESPRGIEPSS